MSKKVRGGRVTPKGTRPRGARGAAQLDLAGIAAGVQERLLEARGGLADEEVVGTAGGGLVSITLSGEGDALAVHIDETIGGEDPGLLEDLVLGALRAALQSAAALRADAVKSATSGLGIAEMPGLDGLLS